MDHVSALTDWRRLPYSDPGLPAEVLPTEGGFELRLDDAVYGVAPGQAAVLYDEGAVVGAGTILREPSEPFSAVHAIEEQEGG